MENLQRPRDRFKVSFTVHNFVSSFLINKFHEPSRKLRRCGKKMPRYCDVNNDKKITLSEWLNCLQTQRVQSGEQSRPVQLELKPPSQPKLKGLLNPLEFILKAD